MKHQNISLVIFRKENTVTLESAWGTLCVFFSVCDSRTLCLHPPPWKIIGNSEGGSGHIAINSGVVPSPTSFSTSPRDWYFLGLVQMTVFGVSYLTVPCLSVCLGTVHDIVNRGGRCLIPVFALGRAQELLLILGRYTSLAYWYWTFHVINTQYYVIPLKLIIWHQANGIHVEPWITQFSKFY